MRRERYMHPTMKRDDGSSAQGTHNWYGLCHGCRVTYNFGSA